MTSVADLVEEIERRRDDTDRPIVVGVSGYGGAGKTTLVTATARALPNVAVIRGDDYLDPHLAQHVSDDWASLDRPRLISEVLEPVRAGSLMVVRAALWPDGGLADPVEIPRSEVYLVDAIGLLHPSVLPWLDLSVWVDTPLDVATTRGAARDRAAGIDHDTLWHEVWAPTERAFERRFHPRDAADVVIAGV